MDRIIAQLEPKVKARNLFILCCTLARDLLHIINRL